MAKNGLITALDIGSSKIVCMIAYADAAGKIKVAGIGHQISQGIRSGMIIDIKKAESSILGAVNAAEKMAGETIDKAIINISPNSLGSRIVSIETKISGHEVTEMDITHIIQQGCEQCAAEETKIIHCIPIYYTIDDSPGIKDPKGMFGEKLSTELHVITASATSVRNLTNCLARCHLDVEDYVVSSYMSGLACLTEDEKNLGVILLDIGAGSTSIAMFAEGVLVYADSIALGGDHITRDIARGLGTSITGAERIKTLYGAVVATQADEHESIEIPQDDLQHDMQPEVNFENRYTHGESYISRALLTSIIKPRVEEILEMVRRNLEIKGFYQVSGPRVVLTGGSAQLQGIRELTSHIFNKHVRVGRPEYIEGMADSVQNPAFSTCIGMLKYAIATRETGTGAERQSEGDADKGSVNRMVEWFKKNF